ncbi:MAG TPA: hypothetical protein VIJ63_09795, partial [Roseiarcus sp.]
DSTAPLVVSRRNAQEKKPWISLASIENQVEAEFLRPALLGESILPYRVFRPFEAVIPADENGEMLDASTALDRGFDRLAGWMRKAEAVWDKNRSSERYQLIELLDYFAQLSSQFPLGLFRVAYAASGTQPAAVLLKESSAVIEHKLYWAAPDTIAEAQFLVVILNSETARQRTAAYQSRGQWGARDFDKVVFNLPIPRFDAKIALHCDVAAAAVEAEKVAAAVSLPEGIKFQRARKMVRDALAESGLSQRIDALVARLLDEA